MYDLCPKEDAPLSGVKRIQPNLILLQSPHGMKILQPHLNTEKCMHYKWHVEVLKLVEGLEFLAFLDSPYSSSCPDVWINTIDIGVDVMAKVMLIVP